MSTTPAFSSEPHNADGPHYVRTRALRWQVSVDDRPHDIGGGQVLLVDSRSPGLVEVWTLENEIGPLGDLRPTTRRRTVQVFGTGQALPPWSGAADDDTPGSVRDHLGSVIDGDFVWHLFEVTT